MAHSQTPGATVQLQSAEDAAADSGESIDTFSCYKPTALPRCIISALSDVAFGSIPAGPKAGDTFPDIPAHSSPACESALLASVKAPRASEESARCLVELARSKALSPLQLEGAALAIERHNKLLLDGPAESGLVVRAGFFIGDGAGIGKGRQIAAVLLDSLCRGRTRHVWVSVSRELCEDARRDLRDIGVFCEVHDGSALLDQMGGNRSRAKGLGAGGGLGKGILFVTYSLLVSGQGRRMEEIIKWLSGDGSGSGSGNGLSFSKQNLTGERSYSGVIVFDEAHKAKNLDADTQTARLVINLQERLPNARVLYVSATGVSDLKHMVYANRLGLWGAGSPLYPSFDSFHETLCNRGVGSMELLALEMKRMGALVARTLSWDGAEFESMEVFLNAKQRRSYDKACAWWLMCKAEITEALEFLRITASTVMWRAFWSAYQRFFREMAICAKVPSVVNESMEYISKGYAVVIGLQSTGEASTQNALDELGDQILLDTGNPLVARQSSGTVNFEDIMIPRLVSTAGSVMTSFVRNHFPVCLPPPEPPKIPDIPAAGFTDELARSEYLRLEAEADRIKRLPPPEPIPALVEKRAAVLEAIRELDLPPNPLDELIDRLGGEAKVAELTGRSGRIVRAKNGKGFHYAKRGGRSGEKSYGLSLPRSDEYDELNISEKKKFLDGVKNVAIISDAASTGISLHSVEGSGSADNRRVHFTIEVPWAADKAIQQLGRTHRSGQKSAPLYKLVVTELGGERRFVAAVAKRMARLGALTKGDRRAASCSDFSEYDIDSPLGRRALSRLYQSLCENETPVTSPSRHAKPILEEFLATLEGSESTKVLASSKDIQYKYALLVAKKMLADVGLTSQDSKQSKVDVKLFLNRIAGLPVYRQKLVFSLFMSTLDDIILEAKATGEFERSVEEVKATSIELNGRPMVLAVDKRSGAKTFLTTVILDRGISLENLSESILDAVGENKPKSDQATARIAEPGFYVSRRQVAGRILVLYAKRKTEPSADGPFDPLGLMIVTRPNTGMNPCEMSTKDLKTKYQLALSLDRLAKGMETMASSSSDEAEGGKNAMSSDRAVSLSNFIRTRHQKLASLWDSSFTSSGSFVPSAGLAPRKSHLGLVTGAVLHILPAMEKAVAARGKADRALRVARVELSASGESVVGVRYPVDGDAIGKLRVVLRSLAEARSNTLHKELSLDERFSPMDEKSMAWAKREPNTMKTFFSVASPKPSSSKKAAPVGPLSCTSSLTVGKKRKGPLTVSPFFSSPENNIPPKREKRVVRQSRTQSGRSPKDTRNITAFFVKR